MSDFAARQSNGIGPVEAAQEEIRVRVERQPVRFFMVEAPPALRVSAGRLAEFLGAKETDIAFVENATAGMGSVLGSLPLDPGDEIVATVGSKSMGDRGKILESLLKEAKSTAEKGMVLRPVKTDRAALSKGTGQFKIGEDIDGLGGFVLESNDGSVMMDYRFKGRLREAWDSSLGEVSRILFRDRV